MIARAGKLRPINVQKWAKKKNKDKHSNLLNNKINLIDKAINPGEHLQGGFPLMYSI